MRENHTQSVKGVIVDPISRTQKGSEIYISDDKIFRIEERKEVNEPFILPGFVDSHVHIESSMLIPSQFARMAVKHGTIAVVTDPHEVANVAGVNGIRFMIQNAKKVPMHFFFGVPSCVPASPFEKSGALINAKEVEKLLGEKDFHFLAEMMNFPGVVYKDKEVIQKIEAAKKVNKPVDGHAPGLTGEQLFNYINSGITTDHECSNIEEAEEKIKLGMKILIREGSAAKNFISLVPLIKKHPKSVMFCTDDCHPDYLETGHINRIVARAVAEGYNLYDVLSAATINPMEHYNLPLGRLRVNDWADFVIVKDLKSFEVLTSYIKGNQIFNKGKVLFDIKHEDKIFFSFRKNHIKNHLQVIAETKEINVIGAMDGELYTHWLKEEVVTSIGEVIQIRPENDFLKIVLLDRYSDNPPVVGFIRGFGLKKGAIAASIAHDSHHILSIGCDDHSIDLALEWIVKNRGGLCYSLGNKVEGITLPYFGLMTNDDGINVSKNYKLLNKKVKENGCVLSSPFMTASFMALTVIPELKIYHDGLFDGINFKKTSLFS
jgi:adenine deaminase